MKRVDRERVKSYSNVLAEADERISASYSSKLPEYGHLQRGLREFSNQTFDLDQSDFELPLMAVVEAIRWIFSWTTVK